MNATREWFASLPRAKRKAILAAFHNVRRHMLKHGEILKWDDLSELLKNLEKQHHEVPDQNESIRP